MRAMIIAALIFALLLVVTPVAAASSRQDRLDDWNADLQTEAIRLGENTRVDHIGRSGERSEYQIMPEIWFRYSPEPLWVASSPLPLHRAEQRRVAREHVLWIIEQIDRLGYLTRSPYQVALIYNAGLKRVIHQRTERRHRFYAERVANIYHELKISAPGWGSSTLAGE